MMPADPIRDILSRIAYDAAGGPFGDEQRGIALWFRFQTFTTTN